jgi:hypothetical protein
VEEVRKLKTMMGIHEGTTLKETTAVENKI